MSLGGFLDCVLGPSGAMLLHPPPSRWENLVSRRSKHPQPLSLAWVKSKPIESADARWIIIKLWISRLSCGALSFVHMNGSRLGRNAYTFPSISGHWLWSFPYEPKNNQGSRCGCVLVENAQWPGHHSQTALLHAQLPTLRGQEYLKKIIHQNI